MYAKGFRRRRSVGLPVGQKKRGGWPSQKPPPPVPAPLVVNTPVFRAEVFYCNKGSNFATIARNSVLRTGRPKCPPISSSAHPQRIFSCILLTYSGSAFSRTRLSLFTSRISSGHNHSSLHDRMHPISCRVSGSSMRCFRVGESIFAPLFASLREVGNRYVIDGRPSS